MSACSRYLPKREGVAEGLVHQLGHFLFEARYILALVSSGMVQDQISHSLTLVDTTQSISRDTTHRLVLYDEQHLLGSKSTNNKREA